MSINPTWDLFIVVFFGLVITYSFIVGKHEAVKIIISTYIAILAVEGIGNIIERLTGETRPLLNVLGLSINTDIITATKLVVFVSLIIFLVVRGGLDVDYHRSHGGMISVILTGIFGVATAGLLLISLFIFVTDVNLLDPNIEKVQSVAAIMKNSKLVQMMILNQDLWVALPALLLIGVGFVSNDVEEE